MKLKMWIGNLDGAREGLVITTSKKRAMKIIPTGRADFDGHWREQPVDGGIAEYEVLYTRPLDRRGTRTWVQGRCQLPDRNAR
jgi:hypothetical protein